MKTTKQNASMKAKGFDTFTATVDWYKSKTWGHCPRLEGYNGEERIKTSANGCGYDKLSTVLAEYLNRTPSILRKMQELKAWDKETRPYGFRANDKGLLLACGGVGVKSLIDGLKAIGIDVMHTDGHSSDHFVISGDFTARKSLTFVDYAWKDRADAHLTGNIKTASLDEFSRLYLRDEYIIVKKYSRKVKSN